MFNKLIIFNILLFANVIFGSEEKIDDNEDMKFLDLPVSYCTFDNYVNGDKKIMQTTTLSELIKVGYANLSKEVSSWHDRFNIMVYTDHILMRKHIAIKLYYKEMYEKTLHKLEIAESKLKEYEPGACEN